MDKTIDDDWFGESVICDSITEAELDEATRFEELVDSTKINLVARINEDRRGDARTTTETTITGDGPVVFSTEVLSMDRLLWADGVMVEDKTDKGEAKMTKGTFAVFRVNLDSRTKSSGTGKDDAIQRARIQVEFHGVGRDADHVGAQRPVVVGWAPFATAEQSNKTTAVRRSDRGFRVGIQAGAAPVSGTIEGTHSSTCEWSESYFDVNRSRPVSVLGSTGESSNYNGVRWDMAHNALAREGVTPELLLYLLMTRQDDREYAVRVTAEVDRGVFRGVFWGPKEHKCVLRVTPTKPDAEKPTVCHLQGKKMWQKLDVYHLENLLSQTVDSSLMLPWDLQDTTGTGVAEGGTVMTATHAEGSEKENTAEQDDDDEGQAESGHGQGQGNRDKNEGAAEAAPNATLTLHKEGSQYSAKGKTVTVAKRRDTIPTTPLNDPAAFLDSAAMVDALLGRLGLPEGVGIDDMDDHLATRVAILENRMELMEDRMARQALLIRGLLRLRHSGPT